MTTIKNTASNDGGNGETRAHHDQSTLPDATGDGSGSARPRVEPPLPHEQDESASSQASASARHKPIGEQAYKDTVGPSVDTDRGPVVDAVYNDVIAPRRGDVPPRQ